MNISSQKGTDQFFIARGEDYLGPWTMSELVERLGRGEVAMTDFVYSDEKSDWVPLLECHELRERLMKAKPKAPPPHSPIPSPAPSMTSAPESGQWFVQKGENCFGPFTYLGLVRALQDKTVYEFDFVSKAGSPEWVRLAEHELFQPERIRDLATKACDEAVIRRQHPRVKYETEVIVHDDRSVWMGRAFEASIGGSGLLIENSTLQPGQVLRVHVASTDELPAFNVVAEIVGKKYCKEVSGPSSPVRYAVRFLAIEGAAADSVREFFKKN